MMKRITSLLVALCLTVTVCGIGSPVTAEHTTPEYELATAGFEAGNSAQNAILHGLTDMESEIDLTEYDLTSGRVHDLMNALINGRADLFHVSSEYQIATDETGKVVSLYPVYVLKKKEVPAARTVYETTMEKILADVDPSWTDVQKLLYLHDYLCLHYAYDTTFTYYDAYHLFTTGTGVCQAYTLVYMEAARRLGLEVTWVSSETMAHIWNAVKLDGNWYYIDVTWDDPVVAGQGDIPQLVCHDNFLLSKSVFLTVNHAGNDWESGDKTVSCTDTRYDNFFWRNVSSAIIPDKNGRLYYMDVTATAAQKYGSLCRYQLTTGKKKVLQKLNACWLSSVGYYDQAYSTPARIGEWIYYNTATEIRRYSLSDGTVQTVCTPKLNGKNMYALKAQDGKLYYYKDIAPNRNTGTYTAVALPYDPPPIRNGSLNYNAAASPGETVTVSVEPQSGYVLKAGSLTVCDSTGKVVAIPQREDFRLGGTADRYHFVMPKGPVTVQAVFVKANAAAPNMGLVGHSVNKKTEALRTVYRMPVYEKRGAYYTQIGGEEVGVTAFGILMCSDVTRQKAGGMTVELAAQTERFVAVDFAQNTLRYDVCDAYQDVSVQIRGINGYPLDKLCTCGYIISETGTVYYTDTDVCTYWEYAA